MSLIFLTKKGIPILVPNARRIWGENRVVRFAEWHQSAQVLMAAISASLELGSYYCTVLSAFRSGSPKQWMIGGE